MTAQKKIVYCRSLYGYVTVLEIDCVLQVSIWICDCPEVDFVLRCRYRNM